MAKAAKAFERRRGVVREDDDAMHEACEVGIAVPFAVASYPRSCEDAESAIVGAINIGRGVSNVAVRGLTIANPAGHGIAVSGASNGGAIPAWFLSGLLALKLVRLRLRARSVGGEGL